ncbi:hypothetical protein Tco_1272728 [Tanacetum coccineum]
MLVRLQSYRHPYEVLQNGDIDRLNSGVEFIVQAIYFTEAQPSLRSWGIDDPEVPEAPEVLEGPIGGGGGVILELVSVISDHRLSPDRTASWIFMIGKAIGFLVPHTAVKNSFISASGINLRKALPEWCVTWPIAVVVVGKGRCTVGESATVSSIGIWVLIIEEYDRQKLRSHC